MSDSGAVLDVVALSPSQRGMVAASAADPKYDPYLVTLALDITAPEDPTARLEEAMSALCRRHPQLTAEIHSEGLPHPILLMRDGAEPEWKTRDLRGETEPRSMADRIRATEGNRPLNLRSGPLTRVTVLRTSDTGWMLLLTMHHVVIDGWSMPLLIGDLASLLRGEGELLPEPVALRNYASWVAGHDRRHAEKAWRDDVEAAPGSAEMPRVGDGREPDHAPLVGEYSLNTTDVAVIERYAREHGLTVSTMLQLAWARILSSMTNQDDVVFGQTSSGRHPLIPGVDRIVGGLVTTVPVRIRVDDRTPAEAGQELQRRTAGLRQHDWLGSAGIARAVGAGRRELFDTLLVVENTPAGDVHAAIPLGRGAEARLQRLDSPSHYPITLVPVTHGGAMIIRAECHPGILGSLSESLDVDRLAERLAHTLISLTHAEALAGIDILLADEEAVLEGHQSEDTSIDGVARTDTIVTVDDALRSASERTPEEVAVIDAHGMCSFSEFRTAVDALAEELRSIGVSDGTPVGVALPRDRRVLVAPFAIFAAGGVTVHMDPTQPPERMVGILTDAGCDVVLADAQLASEINNISGVPRLLCGTPRLARDDDSAEVTWVRLRGDSAEIMAESAPACEQHGSLPSVSGTRRPAYVVFTSGTTGRPKGVVVSHEALLSYWRHHDRNILRPTEAALGRQMKVAHAWSTGFDAAWQPQVALLSNQCLVLLDEETRSDPALLVEALVRHGVDMIDTTPSMLQRLDDAGLLNGVDDDGEHGPKHGPKHGLSVLALGGEALSADTWDRLRRLPATDVWNCYGPTETTVECLMAEVRQWSQPTIGRPLDGMRAAVVDHRLRPLPAGMSGQLTISGPQVAEGYVGRPEETSAVFVADPLSPQRGRRYLTGDLVRRRADETISYEGRIDDQVKINGYRVEPEESAVVLRSLDGVRGAVVTVVRSDGRPWLGGIVVTDRDPVVLRGEAARQLPSYLLPRTLVAVADIPLNHHGKTDLSEVLRIITDAENHADSAQHVAANDSPALRDLRAAIAEIAGHDVDPSSSFDETGVDSIGLMDLVVRLRRSGENQSGWSVRVRDFVESASIADAALRMTAIDGGDTESDALNTGPWPLARLPRAILESLTGPEREESDLDALARTAHTQVVVLPTSDQRTDDAATVAQQLVSALVTAHPLLGARLDVENRQLIGPIEVPEPDCAAADTPLAVIRDKHIDRLNPVTGPMVMATVRDEDLEVVGCPPLMVLTINHLAVDVVSWRIIAEDIRRFGLGDIPAPELPVPEDSAAVQQRNFPQRTPVGPPLMDQHANPGHQKGSATTLRNTSRRLSADATEALLDPIRRIASDDDLLALVTAITDRRFSASHGNPVDEDRLVFTREIHGREGMEETQAVGWFTDEQTYSVHFPEPLPIERDLTIRRVTEGLASARVEPNALAATCLNYLGRSGMTLGDACDVPQPWEFLPAADLVRDMGSPGVSDLPPRYSMTVTTHVMSLDQRPILEALFTAAWLPIDEVDTGTDPLNDYADLWIDMLTSVAEYGTFTRTAKPYTVTPHTVISQTDFLQEDN